MAISTPLSPRTAQELNVVMPMLPPLLHTRPTNDMFDRPQTPTNYGFTSPVQTPQGSPSKKQLPPGANDLPHAFDNAMKLVPTSPTKTQPKSPDKLGLSVGGDNVVKDPLADPASHFLSRAESPTRQSNKENTPTGGVRYGKDVGIQQNQNHAAVSRQEQYHATESKRGPQIRGLTPEELQKLQLPRVKRLANVTQLCKCSSFSRSCVISR